MKTIEILVYDIETDGLPDMDDDDIVGRVAFIWNGAIVSGWPLYERVEGEYYEKTTWESSEDYHGGIHKNVMQWVLFPTPTWRL